MSRSPLLPPSMNSLEIKATLPVIGLHADRDIIRIPCRSEGVLMEANWPGRSRFVVELLLPDGCVTTAEVDEAAYTKLSEYISASKDEG